MSLNSGRTVQYKLNAQSLRLFGLHDDVNDAHRAGANRLQNKKTLRERRHRLTEESLVEVAVQEEQVPQD